ncbi:MAG: tRNA (adenosine(37)-N6)-dimethylallyltransferase MiaA [Chloroflexi bacterium]|nr:tRNA (adenosine(37)-N6)-dimethylallyltransferase MiaA [Chloroflexota bacterium]
MSPAKPNPLPLVVIIGPTAVGKTELAIQLAERLDGEIISADSRLFYRGLDIGTAKPSPQEMARVPHHLIDVANPDETWSLAIFQQKAREVIEELHRRHKLPFLVGGTGQYIRAVTEGWTPPEVQPDQRLRTVLEMLAIQNSATWLHQKLRILDPISADKIDARNIRRTVRALEVILSSGRPFSAQRGATLSDYRLITIGLKRPRPQLYARIDERIELMFENGLLDEVKKLLAQGYKPDLTSMSAIGYREAVAVTQNSMSLEDAKILMKRLTRVFVRRQGNWFKEDDEQIKWFDMNADSLTNTENYIQTSLASITDPNGL